MNKKSFLYSLLLLIGCRSFADFKCIDAVNYELNKYGLGTLTNASTGTGKTIEEGAATFKRQLKGSSIKLQAIEKAANLVAEIGPSGATSLIKIEQVDKNKGLVTKYIFLSADCTILSVLSTIPGNKVSLVGADKTVCAPNYQKPPHSPELRYSKSTLKAFDSKEKELCEEYKEKFPANQVDPRKSERTIKTQDANL